MPWPFQLDMIYKKIKINKLFVCSNIQKRCWLKIIPGLKILSKQHLL